MQLQFFAMSVISIVNTCKFTHEFKMGVRGYHVYQAVWKPFIEQELEFHQEPSNPHDMFAVAAKAKGKEHLAPIIVGHVPIELSRHFYFALKRGCSATGRVLDSKPNRSPLTQGGLEIPCKIMLSWSSRTGIAIFRDFINKSYDMEKCLVDDSPTILLIPL